jgi:putative oxygen-independent coproporphyrinogen III oxidase
VPLGDRAGSAAGEPGAASIEAYLALLQREIAASGAGPPLATIYFGGGTPSLLAPDQVLALIEALERRFGIAAGAEITLELDPASFNRQRLAAYLRAGVNRISLGGQNFDDQVLASLGRRHRRQDLIDAASWLAQAQTQGELRSWSLDLIQALPGQQLEHWRSQLLQATALQPPHLSIYDLTIEPGTVFARRLERGQLQLPDGDLAADLMELTQALLIGAGYGHYEISNYALPGHASRHNRVYWSGAGWWGFGMGATSAPWGVRQARPRTRELYGQWLADQPQSASGELPPGRQGMPFDERLLVGLRRREGVHLPRLLAEAGLEPARLGELAQLLEPFTGKGLLLVEGSRWRLSDPQGLALSNAVLRPLLAWWDGIVQQSSAAASPPPAASPAAGQG